MERTALIPASAAWGPARQRAATIWAFVRARLRRFRTREALERWQQRRVRAHLAWVAAHSPWTAERLAAGPWEHIAPIGKAEMMARFDDLNTAGIGLQEAMEVALGSEASRDFSPTLRGITVGLSSGTSGHRGLFLASPAERALWAGTILERMLPGSVFSRQRVAFFLRANSQLYESVGSSRIRFRFFDLARPVHEHPGPLQDFDPTVLVAPPSLLRWLADRVLDGRLRLAPKRVISVAEVLDPVDEPVLRRAFGGPVHQVYQATEGLLGTTCAHGTLHLLEDCVLVQREWVDEASGRFVPILTDLWRSTQPIVRYRLNDVLVLRRDPCPCGSVHTALAGVEGRSDDWFELPGQDGGTVRIFPDLVRRAILTATDRITGYRVVQAAPDRVEVGLEVAEPDRDAASAEVAARLAALWREHRAVPPALVFGDARAEPGPDKLRRVVRRC